ncbi:twitching motility protein PilT [Photobacterium kishitanii]|uniref:Type IV pili twitching motility protein PilT n=1 Tax=Photobacterium kishitanii TaxID=318456 RepID=A0AAX0YUZ1_9GAMM|nr:PilT/PilU family type 4a pilus ATPase [Photobacterium kishitanii]KJG06196.1 twitching motility protein PilT [Photobacterium kishitanii]KJG55200.1 twitching motility protein PilT [Photobacterium kishitanii]KJG57330.1 twitching motility protein PilT [Photobacterium kishitanii]KJG63554.1 twitching motility protein PilT [Photobacterium kishitanii]KJG65833.1 twitching motility protein PilT [Photobacterium kishitanii]
MTLDDILEQMVAKKASDLYITVDAACLLKIDGNLHDVGETLTRHRVDSLFDQAMDASLRQEFISTKEANFALVRNAFRFRVSAFWQRELPGMVIRRIETQIPQMNDLQLPIDMERLALSKRGLVLIVGATGSGKSTSMAAMIGYRNQHRSGHILTVEDPIEFVHKHDKCIITQREVGLDTASYEVALKNSLRQAPDMIVIGEIRTPETMEYAMNFAETGHLCIATLHANNANQALERILHLVPKDRREQFLFDLSLNLKCILAQQLVADANGIGRHGVYELLLNTPRVADLIRRGDLHEIKDVMAKSAQAGMITFDQSLYALFSEGKISEQDALHHADSANDLRLMIKVGDPAAKPLNSLAGVTLDK